MYLLFLNNNNKIILYNSKVNNIKLLCYLPNIENKLNFNQILYWHIIISFQKNQISFIIFLKIIHNLTLNTLIFLNKED